MPATETLESVASLIAAMRDGVHNNINVEHSRIRYLFRGHGISDWKLEPGVYRPTFKVNEPDAKKVEDARLRIEQHLFQDFRIMSAGLRTGRESDLDLYFLQQHHGMPTRLMDWSNNPLVGLYFAVANKEHDAKAGEFFVLDAYQLWSDQNAPEEGEPDVRGIATSGRKYLRDAVRVISHWKKKGSFGRFVIALHPEHFDSRMSLQRSCFTFHVPACSRLETDRFKRSLSSFKIPASRKAAIRAELAMMGIDDFSIYGDLESDSNLMWNEPIVWSAA